MNGREFWGPHQFTEMHGALTRISLFLSFFCSPPVWFTDFTAGISPLLCVCCEVKSADVLMALSVSVTCMSLVVEYLASSRALLILCKDSTFVCLFLPFGARSPPLESANEWSKPESLEDCTERFTVMVPGDTCLF